MDHPALAAERVSGNGAPVSLARILVALDASDHADRALAEAVRLAGGASGVVTGIHAYAARLHDRRFKQMEGGLPERYREEREMERQRDVHDDLITRGLDIISESYHDQAQTACDAARVPYRRLSPEGKNYARVVEAAETGEFDVIVLGALGLGNIPGSLVGTVCERVARRSPIDTLVIRDPERAIGDGPIVVGLDGSDLSYGALKTALDLGRRLGAEVHAVAAYDPYYHYVAFNKIAGVLSDEAGQVFRFKEQEQLHEELIDDGLAKIYQAHLEVGRKVAADEGADLRAALLDGKPYKAILDYLHKVNASLLLVGRTGVHADGGLDIGGNAENLLRLAPCHVWLGKAAFAPEPDIVAAETGAWSEEAEALLNKAPEFAREMARKAVLRLAHERGHTFVTSDLVEEIANQFSPGRKKKVDEKTLVWTPQAEVLVENGVDTALADTIRLRAEKLARREGSGAVTADHVRKFLGGDDVRPGLPWAAAALARISRVPDAMRARTRARIEEVAREHGAAEVTLEVAEAGLKEARKAMREAMKDGGHSRTSDEGD